MADAVGLASPSSVAHQLKALEAKGFLRRDPRRPRALVVHLPAEPAVAASAPDITPEDFTRLAERVTRGREGIRALAAAPHHGRD